MTDEKFKTFFNFSFQELPGVVYSLKVYCYEEKYAKYVTVYFVIFYYYAINITYATKATVDSINQSLFYFVISFGSTTYFNDPKG